MKLSQAKEYLPFVQAAAEGKIIQFRNNDNDTWTEVPSNTDWIFRDMSKYRIKPAPTLRPWRPEEVPVGALLKHDFPNAECIYLIISKDAGSDRAYFYNGTGTLQCYGVDKLKCMLHSLDHGKTWLPCGVLE